MTDEPLPQAKPPFLRRVRIRGYKSIAFCDVTLEPLTILVGRNASGKSNFLDALAFLRDVVGMGLREAVKRHGGPDAIPCLLAGDHRVAIEAEVAFKATPLVSSLTFVLNESWLGLFRLEFDFSPQTYPRIVREEARLRNEEGTRRTAYSVEDGSVHWEGDSFCYQAPHWQSHDKLLISSIGAAPFEELSDCLSIVTTYNFNPEAIRLPQKLAPGSYLDRDGSNLASVIETTRETEEWAVERAGRFLLAITQTTRFAGVVPLAGYETLLFQVIHNAAGARPIELPAAGMSDGTLRAFAALMAAFQSAPPHGSPSLVAIEEPESAPPPGGDACVGGCPGRGNLADADSAHDALPRPARRRGGQTGERLRRPDDRRPDDHRAGGSGWRQDRGQKLSTLGGLEREDQLEPDLDDQDRQRNQSRDETESQG